jgi:hypothetical protein
MQTPAEMARVFERIRDAVYLEATRLSPDYPADKYAANQAAFIADLQELCSSARLRPDMTADDLWRHVWTKIRYAGFRSAYVSCEIPRLSPFLNDFRALGVSEWRFDPAGKNHGVAVREFLNKDGRFAGIRYNRRAAKLEKILHAAAAFRAFRADVPALEALFGHDYGETSDEALWQAHGRLEKLVGFTTALHVMMDIGFNCVKPDIWMVRVMCRLGWIENVLPAASTEPEIKGRYQRPNVATAVIGCARRICEVMDAWRPEAPLREFDFVMVKYGQDPGESGIVRSLHREWRPVQQIMQWQTQGV